MNLLNRLDQPSQVLQLLACWCNVTSNLPIYLLLCWNSLFGFSAGRVFCTYWRQRSRYYYHQSFCSTSNFLSFPFLSSLWVVKTNMQVTKTWISRLWWFYLSHSIVYNCVYHLKMWRNYTANCTRKLIKASDGATFKLAPGRLAWLELVLGKGPM